MGVFVQQCHTMSPTITLYFILSSPPFCDIYNQDSNYDDDEQNSEANPYNYKEVI